MKIYTKFGDKGQTVLFDGTRVGKDDLRIETYGTVDELNSFLGVAIAGCGSDGAEGALREQLVGLQRELFVLGSDLATPAGSTHEAKVKRIGAAAVARLEGMIDAAAAQLPELKRFVLPGGTLTAARLHVARTVCRRAERRLVELIGALGGEAASLADAAVYLNRLSDLLFMLARLANQAGGIADIEWDGRNNSAGGTI